MLSTPPQPEPTGCAAADEALRLQVWRESLVGDLWSPGWRNAPALRAELRRTETHLCDIYWPRWREVMNGHL
jgi:hypothetical protein